MEKPRPLVADLENAQLPDSRLNERLNKLSRALAAKPDKAFPKVFTNKADAEGFYRFLNNPRVNHQQLFQAHFEATANRAASLGRVAVIHDTTEFAWPLHNDLRRIDMVAFSKARQGFLAHNSLAVDLDTRLRCPLGLINIIPFVHRKNLPEDDPETTKFWDEIGGLFDNENQRWSLALELAHARLQGCPKVVHLLDSEGDSYETLACLQRLKSDFVVRLGQNRKVSDDQEQVTGQLEHLLAQAPVMGTRVVQIQQHGARSGSVASWRSSPARLGRSAKLQLRALRVNIIRPRSRTDLKHLPESLYVHIVEALELEPPQGEKAVKWVLATSEAIDSAQAVSEVLELYELRWLIEEYHKSLKTGCEYENRQVESVHGLLILMSIQAPIAQDLLLLRHLSRACPEAPWNLVVNQVQLKVLKAKVRNIKWSAQPTVAQVCLAIARLGGYIREAKPPGWIILGRGYQELLTLEAGFRLALEPFDDDV